MKLDLMDEITLDSNDKFFVSNIINIDGNNYYLLVSEDDDIIIGYIDGDELVSIEDESKYINVLTKFDTDKLLGDFNEEKLQG